MDPVFSPTSEPTESAIVSLAVEVENVTEDNKEEVCQSIAEALEGEVEYCSLEGPSSVRRRLDIATLYVEVSVLDASEATEVAESESFVESLENLPEDVLISDVTSLERNDQDKNMIFTSKHARVLTFCPGIGNFY